MRVRQLVPLLRLAVAKVTPLVTLVLRLWTRIRPLLAGIARASLRRQHPHSPFAHGMKRALVSDHVGSDSIHEAEQLRLG